MATRPNRPKRPKNNAQLVAPVPACAALPGGHSLSRSRKFRALPGRSECFGRRRPALSETHAVHPEILDHALDVVASLANWNPLHPVDWIDSWFARIAIGVDPFFNPLAARIIGGEGKDIGAL